MKLRKYFFLFFSFILSGFWLQTKGTVATLALPPGIETINALDTLVFDLGNAVVMPTYIDIPVSFISDDTLFAIDFSFKFNEAKLTYDSIINHKPYLTPLANFSQINRKLFFTSSSLQAIDHNTPIISVRFIVTGTCVKVTKSDFNTISAYLNGDPCSYKFVGTASTGAVANFSNNKVCTGSTISFTDSSYVPGGGSIASWAWNLGNGNTSAVQNPSTTYTVSGYYTITLIVASATGCIDTLIQPLYANPTPVATFSFVSDCDLDSVLFTDNSTIASGAITNWNWNFGDATSGTQQDPAHYYAAGGNYTVTLSIASDSGCTSNYTDSLFKNLLAANFDAAGGCVGSLINFSDSSILFFGNITGWNWNFGDGNTSTAQHPSHTYTAAGTYSASLSVNTNQNCSDTIVKTVSIDAQPVVNFSADTLSGCLPLAVSFSDSSVTAPGSSYFWNFGDGDTSWSMNPAHTYTVSGVYTITHIVTTSAGCTDSVVLNSYITVYDLPTAYFSTINACQGSLVNFIDSSTTPAGTVITGWNWNFGDGNTGTAQHPAHTYTAAGTFTVSMAITTNQNCSDSTISTITIEAKPVVDFSADTLTGCQPLSVNFSDSSMTAPGSSFFWDFGDAGTSSSMNTVHTYTASGIYTVTHIVTTSAGCSDTMIAAGYINVHSVPSAFFASTPNDTAFLPNASVLFTDQSSGDSSWLWNFGDGDSSTLENPVHVYMNAGTYNVCLTVLNSFGCPSSVCDTLLVTDIIQENPVGVPSGFTPNGDHNNDVLHVRGGPMKEMEWRIFNEWGNEIFQSNTQNTGWDGKFKGAPQPIGAYLYILKGTTEEDEDINMHGVVNLIR